MYCRECRQGAADGNDPFTSSSLLHDSYGTQNNNNTTTRASNNTATKKNASITNPSSDDQQQQQQQQHHDYNLEQVARDHSAVISPLVLAPMLQPLDSSVGKMATMENIMAEYIATCKFYGCESRSNAGVLTTLRFALPSLRVSGDFHDADMLALAEILLRYGNGPLRFIKRLDFSRSAKEGKIHGQGKAGFRSHGALTLSKVLQSTVFVEEVRLQGNRLGPYGASALFLACSQNRTIKRLSMRQCLIGERGGLAFAELLRRDTEDRACGLVDVDLSVNRMGFRASVAIEEAMIKRVQQGQDGLYVDLGGNLVLQEVMNGVTHGLGIVLAIVGAVLMTKRVQGMSYRHVISCAVYDASLITLYMSSTLYHSFFALEQTRYIFEVFDKCAIYILIAGSYTPFIAISMIGHFNLMVFMLIFIWAACILGIHVEYAYPTWEKKQVFGLCMYLGIGWVAVIAPSDVIAIVPQGAKNLIVLGGVGYTAGVPFFLRNNFLDHSIWHIFVLAASIMHWAAVYYYIVFMD